MPTPDAAGFEEAGREERGAAPLVIEAGACFDGLLLARGGARVEGRLHGDVYAAGRLEIGAQAEVRGRVEVAELVAEGSLDGDVVASERVELRKTARVSGRLRTPRLGLAEGGRFDGHCEMLAPPAAEAAPHASELDPPAQLP